ncbi:hypothetical protein B9Z55_012532 [Caenorhabditis nigoni]|uniref:xanthine dehydrogenase n=1 Tax=Caenorhabditis nigoni TaxID=1611254 RepID=A0A2G5TXQ2_9PELO|nr:hypothetical protein B9Z55_012532 [Caenorhabditis nigoni]
MKDVTNISSYDSTNLVFYVNGKRVEEKDVDPKMTLAAYLRDVLKLTGTKIGCNEGGCGACTIMVSHVENGEIKHFSANSCLMPICGVFGKAVTTVEGIGSVAKNRLHPVQERLAKAHGSQCGFCTPGFVMAMYALLRNNPNPTVADINLGLQGNLCRCTGYRPILEAFYSFAVDENGTLKVSEDNTCGMGENCCKNKKSNGKSCGGSDDVTPGYTGGERKRKIQLSDLSDCKPYDPTQELIFPPELKLHGYETMSFAYDHHHTKWYQPVEYDDLLSLKRELPHARLISGNSELAIELKFRFIDLPVVINPRQVRKLHERHLEGNGVYMGTGMSLTDMDNYAVQLVKELPEEQTGVLKHVHEMLHWFAGIHVRNVASVAGNIATASPISDLNPIWMASNAQVVLDSEARDEKKVHIDEKFFLGYRKTVIQPDEIIKAVIVPLLSKNEHFAAYKQAQRREDDIAIVTGAFLVNLDPKSLIVESIRISYGGMAPTTKLALSTMEKLKGLKWSQEFLDKALGLLSDELKLPAGVPGGMSQYRLSLALSFFFKFFLEVSKKLNLTEIQYLDEDMKIGQDVPETLYATQLYQEVNANQPAHDPLGRPIKHVSGDKHTTGEAVYCDDINVADCQHIAFVLSPIAHGTLNSIDYTAALELDGVIGYLDASDVTTGAQMGHHSDTPVFVKDKITFHGQPIAAIVATDHELARKAASLVKLDYSQEKPIVTIKQALEAESFVFKHFVIHSYLNDNETVVKNDWSKYDRVVEGEIDMGGQEHFYLETQQCLVIPHEDDELEIIISNQCINDVQIEVAKCLGMAQHKIQTKVKRIGGGFGGKESTGAILAVPASLAAKKFGKPMKIKFERFDDMAITGTRHPFTLQYKLAVDENGKFIDLDYTALSNSGHTIDLSMGVMQRAMVHADNVYKFANADITGKMCKTNLASNTAFRGFGGPQGMFGTEIMVKHVAEQFGWDHDEIRVKNFYQEGDCTPFGMHLNQCNVARTWEECRVNSDYDKRLEQVRKFNENNKFRKRGIYLTPTRFGIGFGLKQLNQAGALVLVYTDGSVLVSHGGMEMGQGLHTKILQIAARCLEIPIDRVHIHDTSTDKVPNASATAASVGSDMNGLAVQDACRQIMERLAPFKKLNPDGKWDDWVKAAYVERVSLSASGFGIIHHEPVDFFNGKGAELFGYSVYGTACCEVEVDCLTGDHHLLRTDIVMDVGESLNPAIDIGQIEGAFIQGYGLFTMEEIKIRPDGIRLTRGPGNYKIPSADDAPRHFNVSLLGNSSNKMGIFSSKAIGEPPLFLGSCAFFAIREAVRAYRIQNGNSDYFAFHSPATPERIRMACEDFVTSHVPPLPEEGSYTPWTTSV